MEYLKLFVEDLNKFKSSINVIDKDYCTLISVVFDLKKDDSFTTGILSRINKLFESIYKDIKESFVNGYLDIEKFSDKFDDDDKILLSFLDFIRKQKRTLEGLNLQVLFSYNSVDFTENIRLSVYYDDNNNFLFVSEENQQEIVYNLYDCLTKDIQELKDLYVELNYFPEIEKGKSYYLNENYLFNLDIDADNSTGFFLQHTDL